MDQQMVDLESGRPNNIDEEESSPAIFKKQIRPVTLKFKDVVYSIKTEKDKMFMLWLRWLRRKKTNSSDSERQIIKGISGLVKPGEILAMLGPSGSGKTTLLTALGGRLGGKLDGSITYNNTPYSTAMKRNIGFVTQDDFLYPHLTVMETLVYTALLRLPNTLTNAEKTLQAKVVMTQLELTKCKDSIIGDEFLRGVSGGERRRVSIGQELLINPSLLFLDEPTSGLDSTTAQTIVKALWDLTNGGRTIVMTIHQPSSRLFYMFHKVMLLSDGNTLYFGNVSDVMSYFSSIGYAPLIAMNPADFLLDLANGLTPDVESNESMRADETNEKKSEVKQSLALAYKQNLDDKLKAELEEITNNHEFQAAASSLEEDNNKKAGKWPTTWWQQFTVLFKRGIKERKHESFDKLPIGEVLTVALLCGALWWRSTHLQDQIGLLFFMSGFWGFFPLFQAIFTFPPERKMLEKERTSGTYRLSSYYISRIVGDLPMELILPTVFITIIYWMAGLKSTPANFFQTLFVLLLLVLVAQGMGLALGAVVMDQRKATVLGSCLMLSFLLSGGYYVQHVPSFIAWIEYFSISNYAYKLLVGSQYKVSDTYPCDEDGVTKLCLVGDFPSIKTLGLNGQVNGVVALVIMLVVYRLIAYMALMRIGATKKSCSSFVRQRN